MPKPKTPQGRRAGWGRPITFDLPLDLDARMERARGLLDRTTYVRVAVEEKLNRESQAA